LRFDNFQSVTRDQTLDHYTANPLEIRHIGGLCLKRVDMKRRLIHGGCQWRLCASSD